MSFSKERSQQAKPDFNKFYARTRGGSVLHPHLIQAALKIATHEKAEVSRVLLPNPRLPY